MAGGGVRLLHDAEAGGAVTVLVPLPLPFFFSATRAATLGTGTITADSGVVAISRVGSAGASAAGCCTLTNFTASQRKI